VLDIRTVGLTAGIDFASRPDAVGRRAYAIMEHAFHKQDLVVRASGESIALTPPLIVSEREIDEIFAKLTAAIRVVG
jgi:beta-alanine--pyruvate transaminase